MTRPELHNTPGFHPASLIAAATHLAVEMPRKAVTVEPTAIIRNEGYINGYLDALKDLKAAASPQPPAGPKKEFQPYSQPPTQAAQ